MNLSNASPNTNVIIGGTTPAANENIIAGSKIVNLSFRFDKLNSSAIEGLNNGVGPFGFLSFLSVFREPFSLSRESFGDVGGKVFSVSPVFGGENEEVCLVSLNGSSVFGPGMADGMRRLLVYCCGIDGE